MSRDGGVVPADVRALEEEADALALELLAPEDEVEARLPAGAGRDEVAALLRDTFGLPERFAATRAERRLPAPRRTPLTDRLKKILHSCRSPLAGGEPDGGR
jgi:Zn-dependent peptidase ImmA (M78 family)